jgi:hypothetical protein
LELWLPSTAFWEQWDGSLSAGQALLFAFYLALAALGVGSGWARLGWAGLLPLFTNLSYNLSMSLARNSGGRYLLAVDWVVYFYAALGMIEIALAVLSLAGVSWQRISAQLAVGANEAGRVVPLSSAWPTLVKAGLALVLVGAILPLAEQMAPVRYPRQEGAALLAEAEDTLGDERADLEAFMTQPGAMVTRGRALYPRYYDAGDGEPRTAKTGYEPLDYGRLLFQMVSPSFNGLVMLRSQVLPEYFPNAADVLVVGCFTSNASGGVIDAALVIVEGDVDVVYSSDGGWSLDCSSISSSRQ